MADLYFVKLSEKTTTTYWVKYRFNVIVLLGMTKV